MNLIPNPRIMLIVLLSACGDRSAPQPVTEAQETAAHVTVATPTEEPATPVEPEEPCGHVLLASELPQVVRAGPSADTAQVGEVSNGAVARVSETRNGWAHLASPVAGWVEESVVYDACESPPAVPALPLGERTYLFVSRWRDADSGAGVGLPSPAMEASMGFRRRDARPVAPPTPVTLVTKTGACVREATRRIVLIGHCPDGDPTAVDALEVESCPELTANEDRPHMTAPLMVGVLGRHEGASLVDWSGTEAPTTEPQRANISRFLPSEDDVPNVMKRFGETEWGWVGFGDRIWLLRGDDVLDILDMTSSEPMQVRAGDELLVAVGSSGHHDEGFYMFPNAAVPEQARELGYPAFSCSTN